MEPQRPVLTRLVNPGTYCEVHNYLKKFGILSNFDDGKMLSSPGCIVFGDIRKVYPPVPLDNGNFNCVFIMEQANHISAPHQEFRVLLQLKSPEPLAKLKVQSFLALFNPRPFTILKRKSFSSGPDGVVVWFSEARVPLSKPKETKKLLGIPASTASTLGTLQSIKKSFPLHRSQPVVTTSADRTRDSEDRFNMPPPPSTPWIDMRRNQKLPGSSMDPSDLKTSNLTSRDDCRSKCMKRPRSHQSTCSHNLTRSHHSSCSRHSSCPHHSTCHDHPEHNCFPDRTRHHCCSHEHQACSVSFQPQVACCSHTEPLNCHGNLYQHHSCGCSHGSCHQPAGGCSRHHCCSSEFSKCCAQSLSGPNGKEKTDHQCPNKPREKAFSSSPEEGSHWFVKKWIGDEKSNFRGVTQDIDSQRLTGRATYGGSVVDDELFDDDNFTSISQVLPSADPGPSTSGSQQRNKAVVSCGDSDSDSSLSDTSTLFLKPKKTGVPTKPVVRIDNALTLVKKVSSVDIQATSLVSSDEEDNVDVQKHHVIDKQPSQIEPPSDDHGCSRDPALSDEPDSQKTCTQVFPSPKILPSRRPGSTNVRRRSSDSEDSPVITKKKRKLFNPADSSWFYNSVRGDPDVPSDAKEGSGSNETPCEQIEKPSAEETNTEKEKQNRRAVELTSQESVDIVPPSDVETESRKDGREGANVISANFCGDKLSEKTGCESPSAGGSVAEKLWEGIIMDWGSDNNSSSSAVPLLITSNLTSGNQIIKDSAGPDPVVESIPDERPAEYNEKTGDLQTCPQFDEKAEEALQSHSLLNEKSVVEEVPLTVDHPSGQRSSNERYEDSSSIPTKASSHSTQFSLDDSIFLNETLLELEMSQTLCQPRTSTANVTSAEHRQSNHMSLTLVESDQDVKVQTPAVSAEQKTLTMLSELSDSLPVDTANVPESNRNDTGIRIPETENSSPEMPLISIQVPVTVHAVEGSPELNQDLRRRSPDSTTDGLSEELRHEENLLRNSPASTVFYDAEGDDSPSVENNLEGMKERKKIPEEQAVAEEAKQSRTQNIDEQDITAIAQLPNQIFGVVGAIVDIAPHINEDSKTSIVQAVCRFGCKSKYGLDTIPEFPTINRACKICASRSHHTCPTCRKSGFQKPLCIEFSFELHVLIGEKILRLQVERQEGVKFLGIRAKEFLRKGPNVLEIIRRVESLCCANPEEKIHRLTGQLHVKTVQRLDKIVPLLVRTRLKDFRMSKKPL